MQIQIKLRIPNKILLGVLLLYTMNLIIIRLTFLNIPFHIWDILSIYPFYISKLNITYYSFSQISYKILQDYTEYFIGFVDSVKESL